MLRLGSRLDFHGFSYASSTRCTPLSARDLAGAAGAPRECAPVALRGNSYRSFGHFAIELERAVRRDVRASHRTFALHSRCASVAGRCPKASRELCGDDSSPARRGLVAVGGAIARALLSTLCRAPAPGGWFTQRRSHPWLGYPSAGQEASARRASPEGAWSPSGRLRSDPAGASSYTDRWIQKAFHLRVFRCPSRCQRPIPPLVTGSFLTKERAFTSFSSPRRRRLSPSGADSPIRAMRMRGQGAESPVVYWSTLMWRGR